MRTYEKNRWKAHKGDVLKDGEVDERTFREQVFTNLPTEEILQDLSLSLGELDRWEIDVLHDEFQPFSGLSLAFA